MILRSLELTSFGRFSEKNFEFRRGMNLVVGPNEAGKSTMMAAIPAVLFGVRDKQRFLPWGTQQSCQAGLQFESQQLNIRLERNLLTDQVDLMQFDGMYQLTDQFSAVAAVNSHSQQHQHYDHLLRQLLGVSDETLFRATQFVAQGAFPSTPEEFERFLRTILSGFTQGDSEMVLRSLHDDYAAVTNDNPWSPTPVAARELEVVRDALHDCEQAQHDNDALLGELDGVRHRISLLRDELQEDKQQLQQGHDYVAWIQQQWQEQADEPAAVTEPVAMPSTVSQEQHALEQRLAASGIPVPVPEGLPHLLAQADEVRHRMVALQSEMIPFRDRLQKVRRPDWKRPVLLMLVMIIVALLVSRALPDNALLIWGISALCSAVGWGWFGRRLRQCRTLCAGLQKKLASIDERREEEQQRLRALDDDFEALGIASSAVELVRIQKAFEVHREDLQRWMELTQSDRLAERPVETPSEGAVDGDVDEEIAPKDSAHLTPEELPQALEKLAALDESIRQRETDLLGLVRQEALLLGRLAQGEAQTRNRRQLERRLSELELKKQVLACAIETLTDSLEEFHGSSRHCFETRIGKYLRKATAGKYSAISIEQGFSARLKSRNGQWVALEQLSRGTMDAVCLAIRLGLAHFLTPTQPFPFFFDDVLINLDGDRLQESVAVLERLSSDHQIILFSHDERLHKIAARRRWHVIPLSERRPRSPSRSKEGTEDGGQLSFL